MWSITKYLLELVRERGDCWVLEHSAPDQELDVAMSCWLLAALCDITSACSWRHTTSTWLPLVSSSSPLSSGPKGSRSCVFIGTFTEDWFSFKCSDIYLPRCDFSDTARTGTRPTCGHQLHMQLWFALTEVRHALSSPLWLQRVALACITDQLIALLDLLWSAAVPYLTAAP